MASSATQLPYIPGTEPERVAMDAYRTAVAVQLQKALGIDLEKAYEGVDIGRKDADFHVAVPRFRLGGKPNDWAEKAVQAFEPNEYLECVSNKAGFLTYTARTAPFIKHVLDQVHTLTYKTGSGKPEYGTNTQGNGKHLVLEFSSPNIAKPFHAGHLRSTIIGAFLGNLYEANGWKVTRINYLGDWGKQFGLLAVGFDRFGSEEALKTDPITHLYDVYVKINAAAKEEEEALGKKAVDIDADDGPGAAPGADTAADAAAPADDGSEDNTINGQARRFFKRMEDGEEGPLALWKKFRDLSIEKYKETYGRLNIHFDVYSGESQVTQASQNAAVDVLQEKGIVTESEQGKTLLIDLDKYKLGKTVVRKKDGTTLYITRDIGGAIERWEKYHFDQMIYVVAAQQDLHLAQFFKVLDLMGYEWADRLEHVNFGMVLGMSTRKGTAVFLDQILNEAKTTMLEVMKKDTTKKYDQLEDPEWTADTLGLSAVKIQDMTARRVMNYKFAWDRMTSFEGDTGPYLQYAHVRLSSVERRVADQTVLRADPPAEIDTSLLTEPKARELVYLIASYPDAVRTAFKSKEPNAIVGFCMKLSHVVSSAWEQVIVKGAEPEVAQARLYLYVCARNVLASAMRLLTLTPLERM